MAEDMDVDMSFSDVMDVDISMADADISRLLNGTRVIAPAALTTPLKSHVRAASETYIADVSPARKADKQLNSTFNLDDVDNHNDEHAPEARTNGTKALNVTVDVKNNLNATYDADQCNGNNGSGNSHNATYDIATNQSNLSFGGNQTLANVSSASKNSDYSSTNVTVIEMQAQDQDRTLEANASSRSLNLTRDGGDGDGLGNVTKIVTPTVRCSEGREKVCNLLNITDFVPGGVGEEEDQEEFEDALAPEEEIRQMLDGRRVSLTRHSEEVGLVDQQPDMFDESEEAELKMYALEVESLSGLSSGHSSGNYHDVEQQLERTTTITEGVPQDLVMEPEGATCIEGDSKLTGERPGESKTYGNPAYSQPTYGNPNSEENVKETLESQENGNQGDIKHVPSIEVKGEDPGLTQTLSGSFQIDGNPVDGQSTYGNPNPEEVVKETLKSSENENHGDINVGQIGLDQTQIDTPGQSQLISEQDTPNPEKEILQEGVENMEQVTNQSTHEVNDILDVTVTGCDSERPPMVARPSTNPKRNSLLIHTLSACHDETLRSPLDDSIQHMLDQSVMIPHEMNPQFNSTMNVPVSSVSTPTKRTLLDATFDAEAVAAMSLQSQQEQLMLQPQLVLQTVNRMNVEKVQISKEDVLVDHQKIESAIENKENIAADHRPRASLLLQFDPLASLNTSINKEQHTPVKVPRSETTPPQPVGRLVDVDSEQEYRRAMDAVNEEKMQLMQEINRLKLELNQTRQERKEEKMQLVQEINRLKLEMNQVQQENTTLTLEIQKKEEVYLKAEANTQLQMDQCKQEIKQLLDQLESARETNNNEELLTSLKQELKQREIEIKKCMDENAHYKKIMNEYESTLSAKNCENEKLKNEHATVTQHLAALEVSFSDTISKYDRCKEIIAGYSRNEETLKERLEKSNQIAIKYEERYETLKSHANSQLEKANKDVILARDSHKAETAKLNTQIKRMEIKTASLQHSLEQKNAECKALAQLCDEMTGSA